ncbi:hypothetical protein BDZ91DRAFT_525633 [Kalaharituber pfeilii]|nr:hypothetical protein BDZ91DRAFT_525633 [Kalaharituber pfeilii]
MGETLNGNVSEGVTGRSERNVENPPETPTVANSRRVSTAAAASARRVDYDEDDDDDMLPNARKRRRIDARPDARTHTHHPRTRSQQDVLTVQTTTSASASRPHLPLPPPPRATAARPLSPDFSYQSHSTGPSSTFIPRASPSPHTAISTSHALLNQHLSSLPAPPPLFKFPSNPPILFTDTDIRSTLGGNFQHSTVVRLSEKILANQPYEFKRSVYIKVPSGYHPLAPQEWGRHGAVLGFDVGGEGVGSLPANDGPGDGEGGYPLFVKITHPSKSIAVSSVTGSGNRNATASRTSAPIWLYCGDYIVTAHVPVPITAWLSFPLNVRKHWARTLISSSWGGEILRNANLVSKNTELWTVTVDEALRFFEVEEEDANGTKAGNNGVRMR